MALSGSLPQINLGVQGRALDWFEVLGYRVVEDKATDYAHLKQAFIEQFPVVRNRSELETRFFESSQKHNQKPSDFVYDLLKIHKILQLEMTEEKLIDHIISRLESQILDYVEVRNPQTTSNLLQIIDKYEERFLNRKITEVRVGNSEIQTQARTIVSLTGIGRKIGEKRGVTIDTRTIADHGESSIDLSVKVLRIIADSMVDAEVVNLIMDSTIKAVDKVVRGIDFMKESKLTLDFDQKSLIIPDDQIKQLPKVEKPSEIDLLDTKLDEGKKQKLRNLYNGFKGLFSDQPGLTHVLYHEIDTGDKGPVVSRPYRYDRVKQGIIDYHIEKMLQEGAIRPIQSPYASPVVLTHKNNDLPPDSLEAYQFAIDYRKFNAITKYPRYPLQVIDDLITNIPHTGVMSALDLKSGYFQLAISPKDIEKTAFITRNGTFAFLRMPFGLSGAVPNFQKAIDIILKPVIGRFVMVYMDDVIITSPSFNEHIDYLNQVFTLLRDAGLTLNKEKCHFARIKLKYLGLIISKEGGVGIGAVLNQIHRPIAFTSRTLNKAERNYTVTERECLAVIWALNKFKTYFGSLPVKNENINRVSKNAVVDVLSRNPVDNMNRSQISCAALRALALNSREQLIREQKEDPELGHIYRYLENPDDGSVNATICENWVPGF
ncbi:retrovirus-related Pol polyprotein from transposon 297 [Trichonephila clavipes]|nr:retrovirus-related Pol polyprotein from transposon 297 [Trichonephila clavipes]